MSRKIGSALLPWFKVFEFMPRIAKGRGQASPGALVLASLTLRDGVGRTETYEQAVYADSKGSFTLSLPYSQEQADGEATPMEMVPTGPYRVRSNLRCAEIRVSESQVQKGDLLQVRLSEDAELCSKLSKPI